VIASLSHSVYGGIASLTMAHVPNPCRVSLFRLRQLLNNPKKKYQEPNEITFETKETDKLDNKVSGGVEFSGR
jgi:hypothetical protein